MIAPLFGSLVWTQVMRRLLAYAGGLAPMTIAIVYVLGPATREEAFMMSALCIGILIKQYEF